MGYLTLLGIPGLPVTLKLSKGSINEIDDENEISSAEETRDRQTGRERERERERERDL